MKYTFKEAVNFCLQTDNEDNSDIDSKTGGMSSGEEQELDEQLTGFGDSEAELW